MFAGSVAGLYPSLEDAHFLMPPLTRAMSDEPRFD
jgi:hypothetical protein